MVKLLIFDAGDVLYKTSKKAINRSVKSFLISKGLRNFKKADEIWKKVSKLGRIGKLTWKECQKKWLEELGLDKKLVKEWRKIDRNVIWKKHFIRFPKVNETLTKLKKKGYKLAILSDSVESREEKIESLKLLRIDYKLFDGIFTSHDIGYEKPHRKAFEKVLKSFGIKVKEAIFIGHARDEIEGAKRIGLKTVSFRNFRVKADYFFRKFENLVKVVENIERKNPQISRITKAFQVLFLFTLSL